MDMGYFFQKGRYSGIKTRGLKGACLSRNKLSLNRFLSRKNCFIRKEDHYETFGCTFMYYTDTYETSMGYFFPKIRCTGIKRTARFKEQRLISQKEGFGLLTVYIANSCNCGLISFICDNVVGFRIQLYQFWIVLFFKFPTERFYK